MMRKMLTGLVVVLLVFGLASCASKRGPKSSGDLTVAGDQGSDSAQTYGLDSDSQIYGDGVGQSTYAAGGNNEVLPAICNVANNQAQSPGMNQHYFFEFNKSTLHSSAIASVKQQAQYLISNPGVNVRVMGNTDDRGSREYNVALGWRRANSVSNLLMQLGVRKNQITTVSYGAEKPVAFGSSAAAYQCNRRVDLTFQR